LEQKIHWTVNIEYNPTEEQGLYMSCTSLVVLYFQFTCPVYFLFHTGRLLSVYWFSIFGGNQQ